jgi:hypothetical protein
MEAGSKAMAGAFEGAMAGAFERLHGRSKGGSKVGIQACEPLFDLSIRVTGFDFGPLVTLQMLPVLKRRSIAASNALAFTPPASGSLANSLGA